MNSTNLRPAELLAQAQEFLNSNRIDDLTKTLTQLLDQAPGTQEAVIALNTLLELQQSDPQAQIEIALRYPETSKAAPNLSQICAIGSKKKGDDKAAAEWFENCLKWPTSDLKLYKHLISLYADLHEHKRAWQRAKDALALGFDSEIALFVLDQAAIIGTWDSWHEELAGQTLDWHLTSHGASDAGPGIMVCALPKSASTSLCLALSEALNSTLVPDKTVSYNDDWMPSAKLIPQSVAKAMTAGAVVHCHSPPSSDTIGTLTQAGVQKVIVTLRDPRQALVSWCHHLQMGHSLLRMTYQSQSFRDLELMSEAYKAWVVEQFYSPFLDWIEAWLRHSEDHPDTVMLTPFEAITTKQSETVAEALAWLGKSGAPPSEPVKARFRSGQSDEWKSFFPEPLQKEMTDRLPASLIERFGWSG